MFVDKNILAIQYFWEKKINFCYRSKPKKKKKFVKQWILIFLKYKNISDERQNLEFYTIKHFDSSNIKEKGFINTPSTRAYNKTEKCDRITKKILSYSFPGSRENISNSWEKKKKYGPC